ncbi:hypothetical protein A2U01_0007516 [Trifolium medium]|uniref:Uncharacterized protein n=1 Tax=Trifolium medium TaxID=97028 RepID=A0A392MGQ2_9FABA|nr:hypothetical protein [Trifolium medium]
MDVARLMIRTSGQRVVDEFIDVKVNVEIFHLRVIEDSYGPMRIMVPQPHRQEKRDDVSANSEEEEEKEEELNFPVVEEEVEREQANELEGSNFREDWVEDSNQVVNNANLNLNQEGVGDFLGEPISPNVRANGGFVELKGGVYQDGPDVAYNKLKNDPLPHHVQTKNVSGVASSKKQNVYVPSSSKKIPNSLILPSASLRKQNQLVSSLKTRNQSTTQSRSSSSGADSKSKRICTKIESCSRNSVGKHKKVKNTANSLSSVGSVLCCSSLKSAEIRNCNKKFWSKHENEVASKVWQGVTELGVEGDEEEERYVERLLLNENRDEVVRRQREQNQHSFP